jgi:malate dehydrogenase
MEPIHCAITGSLGNVGYYAAFLVASGAVFGEKQKIILHLLEVPELKNSLSGLEMELMDCAYPTLQDVKTGCDPVELFRDIDCAFLIGAKPRGPGMERKDLLVSNGAIFKEQGRALDVSAKKSVRVLVVGNPCNTNCLIALHNAKTISPSQFFALTYLDEMRSRAYLAKQTKNFVENVSSVTIWGNHSSTLVADPSETLIAGKNATALCNKEMILKEFQTHVRQRGAEIIKIRGKSSAASAAIAASYAMKHIMSEEKSKMSLSVYAKGNQYGIDPDLVFSFPCTVGGGSWTIEPSEKPSEELWKEVLISEKELLAEREMIKHLL